MGANIGDSVRINISEDYMEARIYLSSTPTDFENFDSFDINLYTYENLLQFLNANGIKAGIDTALLKSIVVEKKFDTYLLIAKGKSPENGTNGYYEYNFKTKLDNKPKILEDGSVDYRNIEIYEPVNRDQLIATYVPATGGHYGYNVAGGILSCIPGKDLPPLKGKGFRVDEDGLHYYSEFNGKIELQADQVIVSNILEIKDDVDLTTGDIVFNGDVIIYGNVLTGTNIRVAGNLTILGNVEGCNIFAGGEIQLKSGMQGASRGYITCGGDIWGKFFEQTSIHTKKDLHANSIMNCDILCEGDMYITGRHGIIIGGTVNCMGSIEATIIGNSSEVRTTLNVSSNQNAVHEIKEIEDNIKESQAKMDKLSQIRNKLKGIVNPTDQAQYDEMLRSVTESIEKLENEINELELNLKQKQYIISSYSMSKIKINKYLYPNTYIMLNGLVKLISDTYNNVTVKDVGNEVQIINNY